ncbi:MAG: NERD domain-containing protein [Chloroflexota bacterium]|nr:NERD domain-containing protein [Chloroflexota bacterium]
MRIIRNIGHIKRRKRLARWSALAGFLLLTGTFWLALYPRLIAGAYLVLFFGFLLFNFGMQQIGKWSRNPRADLVLDGQLRRLSDKYAILHYVGVGKRTIEHLFVHPTGVLVLTTRELAGDVRGRGDRWRKRGLGLSRIFAFSGPRLGNPTYETRQDVQAVAEALTQNGVDVEVNGAIVFLNPAVDLDVDELSYPALVLDELIEFIDELPVEPALKQADRDKIVAFLGRGEEIERIEQQRTRRPVKRRAS